MIDGALKVMDAWSPTSSYRGTFTPDELVAIDHPLPGLYMVYSLNTDQIRPGKIGHWTVVNVISESGNGVHLEYFDSLALKPYYLNPYIDCFIANNFSTYTHCTHSVQSTDSNSCGYFALCYCYFSVIQGLSLKEIMSKFGKGQYSENEEFVRKLCFHLFYI